MHEDFELILPASSAMSIDAEAEGYTITDLARYSPEVGATIQRRNAAILKNLRDGVLTIDETGVITTVNPRAQQLLGLTPDHVGEVFRLIAFDRDDLDDLWDFIINAVATPVDAHKGTFKLQSPEQTKSIRVATSAYRDPETKKINGIVAIISDVTDIEEAHRNRLQFGYMSLLVMLFMMMGSVIGLTVPVDSIGDNVRYLNWGVVIAMLIPCLFMARHFKFTLADVGLTLQNLQKSVIEGVIFGILLVIATFGLAFSIHLMLGHEAEEFVVHTNIFFSITFFFYTIHTLLQELLARGLLQGSFKRLMNDERGYLSIIAASLVFGVLHSHYGVEAILVTFVSSLIFGAIYNRHNNLAGVCIAHFLAGTAAFAFGILSAS